MVSPMTPTITITMEMTAENTGLSIKKLTFIDYSPFALFFIPVVESPATIVVSFT